MSYLCKYCSKQWQTSRKRNAHQGMCKLNPIRQSRIEKLKQNGTPRRGNPKPKKEYRLVCAYCGCDYMSPPMTEVTFNKRNYVKHCDQHKLIPYCWNRGLCKQTDSRVKHYGNTHKSRILDGSITPSFTGRFHTEESKLKISESSMQGRTGENKFCKYYEIFSKCQNQSVLAQGSWQYKYAQYLNRINLNWIKSRTISLSYITQDNTVHKYYPDFYLPDSDEYIEIKGYFSLSDKTKMQLVEKYNPNVKIIILMKEDLHQLNLL